MKRAGILILFVAVAIAIALTIAETTGLSLKVAGAIAAIASLLVYLMLDIRPGANPSDATVIRLMRGDWTRKK